MPRLIVTVSNKELDALVKLALSEFRNPREQARFILIQELTHRHLLADEANEYTSSHFPGELQLR